MNQYFRINPNEEYYALMADDVLPETEHWDIILKEGLKDCAITWACDGIQNEGLPTHPFLNGDVVRKLGYIAHPELKHCFIDNCWYIMGQILGHKYYPNIKLTHLHHLIGKAPLDETYKNQPSMSEDAATFQRILPEYIYKLENLDRIAQG
jgi:hypothetical protein